MPKSDVENAQQAATRAGYDTSTKAAPRTTKKDQLIRMLGGKTGAAVAVISEKLGWQQHTTRAALTGLRKAGFELAAEKPGQGKPARYRIIARPGAVKAGTDVSEVTDAGSS